MAMLLLGSWCLPEAAAEPPSFGGARREITVYLAPVENHSGVSSLNPQDMQAALREALLARKSLKFTIVDRIEQADLAIQAEILKYDYREHDPVDMIIAWGAAAMDAMKAEPYAAATVRMTVSPHGRDQGWQGHIRGTVTQSGMQEADAPRAAFAKTAQQFITTYFHSGRYQQDLQ